MLGSATRIERDMAAYAGGARGHVRILASASVMAESLAEDVAGFLQDPAHRNIRVDMEERVSPEIVRGIREGVASIGLCWDAADLDGLERRDYRSDHLAIVAHPSHPVARHDAVRFEQVLDHEFVGMPALSAVQLMLAREAAVAGKPLVYRVLVSNFDAALRVVRAGLAISVVPAEVARPFTEAFGLRLLPLTDDWARRRFAHLLSKRGDAVALGAAAGRAPRAVRHGPRGSPLIRPITETIHCVGGGFCFVSRNLTSGLFTLSPIQSTDRKTPPCSAEPSLPPPPCPPHSPSCPSPPRPPSR